VATARPGWSRRAQYSLFFSFLALIAGILVGLFLLALSLLAPARFESVRGAALDITGPISSALHEVTETAKGLVTGAGNYWDAANQNGGLRRERDAMRSAPPASIGTPRIRADRSTMRCRSSRP